jgi:serine/threonine protein kinase
MIAPASRPIATFHRIDPDTLCLACLHAGGPSAICAACGFDERAAVSSPLHLPPRTILHGQYLLGRALGQGGFGVTYLAWDLNLEMPVAIKEFLPTDFASRASAQLQVTPYGEDGAANFALGLDAFEGEARALARCNALPGVVDVLGYFRENGTGYIVMHYMRGRTFRDHLRARGRPLPFEEAAAIVRPVLDALQEVHRLGLVHRDISPDNIYICDSGRVCLLDFGAARNAVRDRSKSLSVQFKIGYTPEEQYRRHGEQGPWTDVYAAAATFYRAITGSPPPSSLDRLTRDQLRPPGALGVAMPRQAERALMRALAVQSSHRYRTVAEFSADLALPVPIAPGPPIVPGSPESPGQPVLARTNGLALAPLNRASLSTAGRWLIAALADSARLIRAWLDGALFRARSPARAGGGERAIREQLAALWPVTLVSVTLRAPHLPAGPEHGPLDVYARDEIASVAFGVVLQNNYAGIRPLRGSLRVAAIGPEHGTWNSAGRLPRGTMDLPVPDLVDRAALEGAWAPEAGFGAGLDAGVWRFDFIWDGRKIGEREFVISA